MIFAEFVYKINIFLSFFNASLTSVWKLVGWPIGRPLGPTLIPVNSGNLHFIDPIGALICIREIIVLKHVDTDNGHGDL